MELKKERDVLCMQMSSPPAYPLWRQAQFVVLFLLFALLPLMGYAHDALPPFDYAKAKQLSEDKRRAYDVVFFNEIVIWNKNSNRYGANQKIPGVGRDAEFRRMASNGYLPAYVALRLLDIVRGSERDDPAALAMLLKAANEGDASAMCAFLWMPIKRSMLSYTKSRALGLKMEERGLVKKHPACMATRGMENLFGNVPDIPKDTKAGKALLLESARQDYYLAENALFDLRELKALAGKFDFSNKDELKRTLCWGRLAEQHTNWAGFDNFLGLLRDYARSNNRPDLVEMSHPYDPRRVPITQPVVKPEDCIQLEKGD